jgi:putrescine aminotransferase
MLSQQTIEQATEETADKFARHVNPSLLELLKFGGFDKVEWEGCGSIVRDLAGNEYIDCLGGYGVFTLGHSHPKVVDAVIAQIRHLPLSSKTFLNKPLADLAAKLAEVAPGDLQFTFMCNSGAEAVEGALKIARMATGRTQIISAVGSYHGKTFGALSASDRETYKAPFEPLLPDFIHVPFGDSDAVANIINDQTAAVILEPVQGENGIRIPPDSYLPRVRELCTAHGALLILDEVQSGLGRTGKVFACEHWNVAPDIMTLAKALGDGVVPAGAVIATPDVWEKVFRENPLIHTSTFGGNPVACVAGLAALETLVEEDLPHQAQVKGNLLLHGLRDIQLRYPKLISDVRGLGLMIGVEFDDADIGKLIISALLQNGVLAAYTLNNPKVMRFEPPLVISEVQIHQVLAAFEGAMESIDSLVSELL